MNNNLVELLAYLHELAQVQGSGHYVNEEIKECIKNIRIELGLDKIKRNNLKESQRLIFGGLLGGNLSFYQNALFEAVYGSSEEVIEIVFEDKHKEEIVEAVKALKEMNTSVEIDIEDYYVNLNIVTVRK